MLLDSSIIECNKPSANPGNKTEYLSKDSFPKSSTLEYLREAGMGRLVVFVLVFLDGHTLYLLFLLLPLQVLAILLLLDSFLVLLLFQLLAFLLLRFLFIFLLLFQLLALLLL